MNLREWALPVYTILIQLVTGMFIALWLIRTFTASKKNEKYLDEMAKIPVLIFFFTIIVAMIGSHFHLSRPFKSFLALANIRNSWLSREVFFTLIMLLFTGTLLSRLWLTQGKFLLKTVLGWGAILSGLFTIFCMANIYDLPTQVAWNTEATSISYYGTTLLLGVISLFVILLMDIEFSRATDEEVTEKKSEILMKSLLGFVIAGVIAAIWVVIANLYQVSILRGINLESAQTSLLLLLGLYKPLVILRFVLLAIGLGCFIIYSSRLLLQKQKIENMIGPVYVACLCVMVGEILERFLFYATHVRIGI